MRLLFLLIFIFSIPLSSIGQEIYTKKADETLESFIQRNFPAIKDSIVYKIQEGAWGNTNNLNKIIVFYKGGVDAAEIKAIVLQQVSAATYRKLDFGYTFAVGVYPWNTMINGVFYYDTDDDGLKELVVVQSGSIRCSVDVEMYNEETKKNEIVAVSATCDDCAYDVFRQESDGKITEILSDENEEWQCDANAIKEILDELKKAKN